VAFFILEELSHAEVHTRADSAGFPAVQSNHANATRPMMTRTARGEQRGLDAMDYLLVVLTAAPVGLLKYPPVMTCNGEPPPGNVQMPILASPSSGPMIEFP
jgi:hypothetical protein